jgi:hypothetical protein
MRPLSLTAVLLAIALLPLSLGLGVNDHKFGAQALRSSLTSA